MRFAPKLNEDGTLDFGSPFNHSRWREFCKMNKGKVVKIEKEVPLRSLTQNAFYWAYLHKVSYETGNDPQDLHIYLRRTFLPKKLVKIQGRRGVYELQTDGSTTELNKAEFGEYLDRCAAHVGIPLPTPEEIQAMGYISNKAGM